ncbi:NAD/NADP-dependent betaine aldehyde dehydrogenase [Paraburkholderia nemoris]|uniref:NAD/NADP-dependent betaine aldehyde dehydrogenase n=1 Tax=Paraburkholderia nemoris TaxID=2793076 RepID=A0ABM8T350_9BURK|nr:NAD/NADP-dependent betaine aldehyde dehydrogenase [Paraburkholderia nemoris]CAE6854436.1 NAD/NADP-dependent betaine aldehyde dehydrogenase [Paraburkholderia nemoris]CAE6874440.1 NAD/NADP-dependent betaine aldehyde dehydrogenase [Paraburkholderia domus]CAE6969679.1 NAD/NADP-dependent betaine aldehyde dehydrogenase [Paraburkholderia nemoris]
MNIKPFLIGGEWVQGTGTPFDSVNPANGELNGRIGGASAADVDHAVRNAQRAQRDPRWRNMLPHERARLLNRVADLIVERGSELASIQMRENGKLAQRVPRAGGCGGGRFPLFRRRHRDHGVRDRAVARAACRERRI